MKIMLRYALIFLFSITFSGVIRAQEDGAYAFLKTRLSTTKAFTLEVMDAMPAAEYSFKPTEDVRSFAAQAFHLAYSTEWFRKRLEGKPEAWNPGDENRMSREEVIAYFNEQMVLLSDMVMQADENPQFLVGLMGFLDHNSHHRGQMISYLRMKGIPAPSYR